SDLVIVHRTNTYEGQSVAATDLEQLAEKILNARSGKVEKSAKTKILKPDYNLPKEVMLDQSVVERYSGTYKHPFLGNFTVRNQESKVFLDTNIGVFRLFATDTDTFFPEDLETLMQFLPAPDQATKFTIKPVFGEDKKLQRAIMYY
ncbi:MAG TPA: hypothetical protein VKN14_12715, partial [Flavobacteriaceae bacterium]|nr:hypothetical protein [Flavobacteriaceae bacterium]